jgi:hypothetical protein
LLPLDPRENGSLYKIEISARDLFDQVEEGSGAVQFTLEP